MTRELAVIHARENIRVNALCPGPLKTELLMKYLNTDEKKQRRLVHIPMGRFGLAEEIAKGVVYLASDEVMPFLILLTHKVLLCYWLFFLD
jgi:NAD(P)-dependent dehydrogenase (short-subunit alcohol dehydrogenase family)